MPGGNAKQGERRALGGTASLLPIAKGMNADTQCFRELFLCQACESSESRDVFRQLNLAAYDTCTLPAWHGAREVLLR